jgi:hypothetical protein
VNGSRIAVDNNGYIYLIDGNTITKYDSSMIRITSWIYTDIGTSQFNGMNHICVDANGLLFTVESNNNRVQKFDINGNSISSWGTLGNANGQFNFPSGISVDDSSFIYVADTLNSRIQKFTLDGKFVSKWGSRGTANWQFQRVKSIDVDAQGCVYALDSGNNRIHKYSPVSSSSTEVKRFQEGKSVLLNGVIVTAGTSEMGDCFYVESEDRSSGIKVTGKSAARGSKVLVQGTVTELDGEAVIEATSVVPLGTGSVEPVGMNNAALGGSSAGLQQALWGIRSGSDAVNNTLSQIAGLNNVGLLVRLWGKVSRIDVNNRNFFVDDGFGDPLKCSVPAGVSLPGTDDFVSVTGISSCRFNTDQHLIPLIRVRDQDDIRILVDK